MAARPEVKQKCKFVIGQMAKDLKNFRKDKRTKTSSLRIDGIRRQLEELKVKKPEMKKRINKILGRVNKDLEDDSSVLYPDPLLGLGTYRLLRVEGYTRLIYDRKGVPTDYPPEIEKELKHSAQIAIRFFNQKSCTEYSVVDVVKSKLTMRVPDYVFDLVLTAKLDHKVADVKTFKARISHGVNPTRLVFVRRENEPKIKPEEDSSSSSVCGSRERRKMATRGYDIIDARVAKIIRLITKLQQKEATKEEEEKLETERLDITINEIMREVKKLLDDKLKEEKELEERRIWLRRIVANLNILQTVDQYPSLCRSDEYGTVIYDPDSMGNDDTKFIQLASKAIKRYNEKSPTKYSVENVILATQLTVQTCGRGRSVILKFTASMPEKAAETFEALLNRGGYPGAVEKVMSVRIVN